MSRTNSNDKVWYVTIEQGSFSLQKKMGPFRVILNHEADTFSVWPNILCSFSGPSFLICELKTYDAHNYYKIFSSCHLFRLLLKAFSHILLRKVPCCNVLFDSAIEKLKPQFSMTLSIKVSWCYEPLLHVWNVSSYFSVLVSICLNY